MTTTSPTESKLEYPKHLSPIHYSDPLSRLQTLDIWLPRPLEQSDPDKSLWIIFIHGGAWRDSTQTSHNYASPTLSNLPSLSSIAGFASLNYRLSPYPNHPTDPSFPTDADRNVAHPTHVRDVAAGLSWLRNEYGLKRWVGIGHSCGATLLSQYVSAIGLEDEIGREAGPEALILTAGIYNIPLLLRNHSAPGCLDNIAQIYTDIVTGAFGPASSAYMPVSPVSGKYGTSSWPNGKLVVLAHSYEDELVERAQRDVMCVALDREGWSIVMEDGDEEANVGEGKRVLEVRDIKGKHDFVWEDGEECAKLVAEVVERLTQ